MSDCVYAGSRSSKSSSLLDTSTPAGSTMPACAPERLGKAYLCITPSALFHEHSALISQKEQFTFYTMPMFINILDRKIKQCLKSHTGCYVLFRGINQELLTRIDSELARSGIRNGLRFTFEPASRALIIKLMPGLTHEIPAWTFLEIITDEIKSLPRHTRHMYDLIGTARFREKDGRRNEGRGKEGDGGLRPVTRKPSDFPSFVIEAAFTESASKLECDAAWWLTKSAGAVKMVLTILITRNPWGLVLQYWEMVENIDPGTRDTVARIPSSTQSFTIDSEGDISPPNKALKIPYLVLFDVPHKFMSDIVISPQELKAFALQMFSRCP